MWTAWTSPPATSSARTSVTSPDAEVTSRAGPPFTVTACMRAPRAARFRASDTMSRVTFAGPWIVDANHARDGARIGAGALLTWDEERAPTAAVTHEAFPPRTFVDPTGGVALPDGRVAMADANADPARLGHDGLGRGVYGSGRGCVVAIAPDGTGAEVLVTSPRFVTPIAVAVAPLSD